MSGIQFKKSKLKEKIEEENDEEGKDENEEENDPSESIIINEEQFKRVPNFDKYYVSKTGKVFSLCSDRLMTINIDRFIHDKQNASIGLQDNCGEQKRWYLNRLVATTWLPNPNNYPEVNHIDANIYNNNVSNLEWVTHQQNIEHAKSVGLSKRIKPKRKVIKCDMKTGLELKEYENIYVAANAVDTSHSCIRKVLNGQSKQAGGFFWKYKFDTENPSSEWRPLKIDGHDTKYQVSNNGEIKGQYGVVLKGSVGKRGNGYKMINLTYTVDGTKINKNLGLHRLIALAFIPNPENKPFIDHIDTNRLNNHVSNLRWCTRIENMNNPKTTSKRHKSVEQWSVDGKRLLNTFDSIKEAKNFMWENYSLKEIEIARVCKKVKKYNTAGGFLWKFTDISTIEKVLCGILNQKLIDLIYEYYNF